MQFKLNNKFNIAIEDRFTITNDDLVDGQQWAEPMAITGQFSWPPAGRFHDRLRAGPAGR